MKGERRPRRWRHLLWVLPLVLGVPSAIRVARYPIPVVPLTPLPGWSPALGGALHVHSTRSDGRGTPEEIAAAAKAAGLRFVVLADHNVPPEPPRIEGGVTLLFATEVTTRDGHLLAFDFEGAPPPAGTPAHEVDARIRAAGGFTVVAHGHDPKAPWRRWDLRHLSGMEIYNAGADARRSLSFPFGRLLGAAFAYPFNSAFALVLMQASMRAELARFDDLAKGRNLVAFCGLDAHGLPGYELLFRGLRTYLDRPAEPARAPSAREVWDALRRGHHYCAIDLFGDASRFHFTASRGAERATMGDSLLVGEPIELEASIGVKEAERAIFILRRDGEIVARNSGGLRQRITERGAYRVEVRLPITGFWGFDDERTWIYSNPIFVRRLPPRPASVPHLPSRALPSPPPSAPSPPSATPPRSTH